LTKTDDSENEVKDENELAADPPAGLTLEDFSHYVAVDGDIQIAADIADEELVVSK